MSSCHGGGGGRAGGEGGASDHGEDGLSPDVRLDPKPSTTDQRAHHPGNIRAAYAKRRSSEDREGYAVFRSRVAIQDHRREYDEIGDEYARDSLPRGHAEVDDASRQGVRGDAHDETDPQRRDVVGGERACAGEDGGEVLVDEFGRRVGDGCCRRDGLVQ